MVIFKKCEGGGVCLKRMVISVEKKSTLEYFLF